MSSGAWPGGPYGFNSFASAPVVPVSRAINSNALPQQPVHAVHQPEPSPADLALLAAATTTIPGVKPPVTQPGVGNYAEMMRLTQEYFKRTSQAPVAPVVPLAPAAAPPAQQQQQHWNAAMMQYAYYSLLARAAPSASSPSVAPVPQNSSACANSTGNLAHLQAWYESLARHAQAQPTPDAFASAPVAVAPRAEPVRSDPSSTSTPAPAPSSPSQTAEHLQLESHPSVDQRKRVRTSESDDNLNHKQRKRRGSVEAKVCVNCGVSRTPFWRKERDGEGSLCNACGLYLAKNDAPRPQMLWKRGSSDAKSRT